MSQSKTSLLAIIFPSERAVDALRFFINVHQLSVWLHFELHLLASEKHQEYIRKHFKFKKGKAFTIISHAIQTGEPSEIQELLNHYEIEYLCIENGDFLNEKKHHDAHQKRRILEKITSPIFLLPAHLVENAFKETNTFTVPLSGERRRSESLTRSLKLAKLAETSVTLIHVTQLHQMTEQHSTPLSQTHLLALESEEETDLENIGEHPHHEYPFHLERIVSEGSPESPLHERMRASRFFHVCGRPSEAISHFIKVSPHTVLVLEWKGRLALGRARTFRNLVRNTPVPVLIVKAPPASHSTLKTGHEFEAA